MATFVLSVLGDDRSGLVGELSGVISACGGNWDRSHMTQLAGKFAGVVMVTIPDTEVERFLADLVPLEQRGLLDISVEAADADAGPAGTTVRLELVGSDHPGIVHRVSNQLAHQGVSIDDLQTWTSDAAMTGERLFHAHALLRLPDGLDAASVQRQLEELAVDLMVDIELE